MGGALKLNKAVIEKRLRDALRRYEQHEHEDADMVAAGEELARTVADLVIAKPCTPSREMALQEEPHIPDTTETAVPLDELDDYGYRP